MITSADEFVRLRTSEDRDEYHRAAHDEAPLAVWEEVLERFPDMHFWVAQNKQVPTEILRRLAESPDPHVREMVARKGKLPPDLFPVLARDPDASVRAAIAVNRKTPVAVRRGLLDDPEAFVREAAAERLTP